MSQEESIGRWISLLYRQAKITIGQQLKQCGIGTGQYPLLLVLYHEDGIIQDEIAHRLGINKATTARGLKKLEHDGFVTRERDPDDMRAFRIHLTEKGRSLESQIRRVLTTWTGTLSAGFSKQEKNMVLELLKRMHENAMKQRYSGER